jgi:hypothetical protein
LDVLRWIADECPQAAWTNDSHKISARALEVRNLVTVSRRAGRWHAQIKPDGAYYLAHGHYPDQPAPRSAAPAQPVHRTGRQGRHDVDVEDLIARLQDSGSIRVEAPSPSLRSAYRRAVNAAVAEGKVPASRALRHTGRDHGDLVISLVKAEPTKPKPAPVPIPNVHDPHQSAIQHLLEEPDRLSVSQAAQPRALALIQGLADEVERRGHQLLPPTEAAATFRIEIGEDNFNLLLTEESEKVDRVRSDQVAAARYAWQRVSSQVVIVPSGRLVLELLQGWHHRRWADRVRWRLEDKFPIVLELIEQLAAETRQQRVAAAEERARQRRLWDEAVPRARDRFVYNFNAERLQAQARASSQAAELRAYCERLAERVAVEPDRQTRGRLDQWMTWGQEHAEAVDPLNRVDDLRYVTPAEISAAELDLYMPGGLTVRHPPDRDHARS